MQSILPRHGSEAQHGLRQMHKIDTGYKTIFRVENALDVNVCNQLCDFMIRKLTPYPNIENEVMPWHDGETFIPWDLPDNYLKNKIRLYRKSMTEVVSDAFKKQLYPEFTHLVLWRTGRRMSKHKDDGYDTNDPLDARKVSSVTYLNDNFIGGETFIANETGMDYISKPVAGSFVCYLSDESNSHGVNEITKGNRITLPIWFTDDYQKSEINRIGF